MDLLIDYLTVNYRYYPMLKDSRVLTIDSQIKKPVEVISLSSGSFYVYGY